MNWKRIIVGEPMPDKDDPKYKKRYERDVNAGRCFAQKLRIDKLAASIQGFAQQRTKIFMVLFCGTLLLLMAISISRIVQVCMSHNETQPAVQTQEMRLRHKRHKTIQQDHTTINSQDHGQIETD